MNGGHGTPLYGQQCSGLPVDSGVSLWHGAAFNVYIVNVIPVAIFGIRSWRRFGLCSVQSGGDEVARFCGAVWLAQRFEVRFR